MSCIINTNTFMYYIDPDPEIIRLDHLCISHDALWDQYEVRMRKIASVTNILHNWIQGPDIGTQSRCIMGYAQRVYWPTHQNNNMASQKKTFC